MSCDWDIFCRTCNAHLGYSDANHEDEVMVWLVTHAAQLAAVGKLLREVHADGGGGGWRTLHLAFDYSPGYGADHLVAEFFAAHEGHDLAARSEYGNFHDRCDGMDVRHEPCQLPPGHEGEHQGRAAATILDPGQ